MDQLCETLVWNVSQPSMFSKPIGYTTPLYVVCIILVVRLKLCYHLFPMNEMAVAVTVAHY